LAILRSLMRRPAHHWQPLEAGWRRTATDTLEVQVVRVAELGWQVELRDTVAGLPVGRPTFSPRLEDAARIARYLCARYADRPAGCTPGVARAP
jgi:hypothetical protein